LTRSAARPPLTVPGSTAAQPDLPAWVVVAMVTLMGLNLRAPIGSVPPLLTQVSADLHLSGTAQGLLTSVSIAFLGLSAPLGQKLSARIGAERATTVTLGVLALGCALRLVATDTVLFLISSAVAGIGMGSASALIPSLIAHHLRRGRGFAMGLYSTGLALGVALAAGIAVPSERWLGGWRPALALWGALTAATAVIWALLVPRLRTSGPARPASDAPVDHRLPWRSTTAWWLTWFTAAAMIIGFSGLAWVTPLYVWLGVSPERAAWYFVLFQLVQLAAMLTLPSLTDFTRDRRPLLALVVGCSAVGISFLLLAPLTLAVPAVCLFGLGAGGGSTLGLVLIVDVTDGQAGAARLSAMVMLIGYLAGALGPVLLGLLLQVTGGFTIGYSVVLGLAVLTLATVPVFHPDRRVWSDLSGSP
jgi:MFS transporter, CP family, cyanate transporter